MSNRFNEYDSGSMEGLQNGTAALYVGSMAVSDLVPNLPVKTDANKTLYSSKILITDIQDYDTLLKNPFSGNLIVQGDVQCDSLRMINHMDVGGDLDKIHNFNAAVFGVSTNITGSVNADKFIRTGGTSSQYLMADGSVTSVSGNNQNSNIYLYRNSTALSGVPPAPYIRFDVANQQAATKLYFSFQTEDGLDIDPFLNMINATSIVYLQEKTNSTNYIKYNVSSISQVANSYTLVNVAYIEGGGTGLTSFGNDVHIFASIFVDVGEIDTRITMVEVDTATLESKVRNITSADAYSTTMSGILNVSSIDSGTIKIGPGGANAIDISYIGSDITTNIYGASTDFENRINSPLYDVKGVNPINIGVGSSTSTAVNIGHGTIPTNIYGSATNIQTLLTVPTIDIAAAGTLTLGGTTATKINIGKVGMDTVMLGNLKSYSIDTAAATNLSIGETLASGISMGRTGTDLIMNSKLKVGNIDSPTLQLNIGASTAPSVYIGRSGAGTVYLGGLSVDVLARLNTPLIDTASAVPLSIGTTTTNGITIGRTGANTTINGALATIATRLNCPLVDVASGGISIGTSSTTTVMQIGNANIPVMTITATAINASTRVNCPLFDVSGTTLNIGTSSATTINIGKASGAAVMTLNCTNLLINQIPPANAYSIPKAMFVGTPLGAFSTTPLVLSTGTGTLSNSAGTLAAGACFRVKFCGQFGTVASGNTMTHDFKYGTTSLNTQTLINYTNVAALNSVDVFSVEYTITIVAVSPINTALVGGIMHYTESGAAKMKLIQYGSAWTTPIDTSIIQLFAFNLTGSGTMTGTVSSFTVERLR